MRWAVVGREPHARARRFESLGNVSAIRFGCEGITVDRVGPGAAAATDVAVFSGAALALEPIDVSQSVK